MINVVLREYFFLFKYLHNKMFQGVKTELIKNSNFLKTDCKNLINLFVLKFKIKKRE